MIATELREGDIIEIVQFDEDCNKSLRRVQVRSLAKRANCYRIVGVNMKGKNSIEYRLPLEPLREIVPQADSTGWLPFVDHGEADE